MKWPVDIIEKIAKRKVVLFLGAGVSANAISEKGDKRPPTWEQFLNKGISEVTDENIVEYVRKLCCLYLENKAYHPQPVGFQNWLCRQYY